jgi:ribulose kinase
VLPDFHGNRSPEAEPRALGVISGLALDAGFDGLCRLYFRTAVAIALQVRQLLEVLEAHGYDTGALHVVGGHTRNLLLMELYAEVTGRKLLVPEVADATLLGAAMAAATACGLYPSLGEAAAAMRGGPSARRVEPRGPGSYDRDYAVFRRMIAQRREIAEMMPPGR